MIKAWHNISGLLFAVLGIFLCLGGFFALYIRKYSNFDWNTKRLMRLVNIHKTFGYIIIFTVQFAVVTGILRRYQLQNHQQGAKGMILTIANVAIFVLALLIGEIRHRRVLNSYVPFK